MSEMDNFPSNSKKLKEAAIASSKPVREVRKVADGAIIKKKKSVFSRVKEAFAGDGIEGRATNIVEDILIPTAFNAFLNSLGAIGDGIMSAFEVALFPGGGGKNRRRYGYGGIDYNRRYRKETKSRYGSAVIVDDDDSYDNRGRNNMRSGNIHDFSEIGYKTKEKALDVLEEMQDWLEEYDKCPTRVFYSASGVSSSHQDEKWGWYSLNGAKPIRVPDNEYPWRLMLPKPVYFND